MSDAVAEVRLGRVLVAALYIAYVASFAWSIAVPDTARDAFIAHGIRHGLAYPLEGPVLGVPSAIHFGPFWYYLVSLPLWVSDTWMAFVLFQGMVCALKFPLAWHCGRLLLGARFGLLWCAVLALPGWTTMEGMIPFNASAVEAASLGVLAAWLHARERPGSWKAMLLLGLALDVALHVHPTTAPLAVMGLAALYWSWRGKENLGAIILAFFAGAVVLFIPYFVSQALAGWPDMMSARGYVTTQLGIGKILLAPRLLLSQFYDGPFFAAESLARWPSPAPTVLGGAVTILAILACAAAAFRREGKQSPVFIIFVGATLALLPWLLLLRPNTPFYFMNVIAPFASGAVAAGLDRLPVARLRGAMALAGIALVTQVTVLFGIAANANEGGHGAAAQVLDVKNSALSEVLPDIWFPAIARADLGGLLCANIPLAAHGALAFIEDRSVGTDAIYSCDGAKAIDLGGTGSRVHLVGLTVGEWKSLGIEPPCRVGSLGVVASPGPFGDTPPQAIAEGSRYFPRSVSFVPVLDGTLRLSSSGPGCLVVSNPLYGYERLEEVSVSQGGRDVAPSFAHIVSRVYAAPSREETTEWVVRYRASSSSAIDIVFVPASAVTAVHGC
jgi:hypothetical protein